MKRSFTTDHLPKLTSTMPAIPKPNTFTSGTTPRPAKRKEIMSVEEILKSMKANKVAKNNY